MTSRRFALAMAASITETSSAFASKGFIVISYISVFMLDTLEVA
jgi:hypothetical protein